METFELRDYIDCPEKLTGRLVLLTIGSVNLGQSRKITKIVKATKSAIIIESEKDTKYNWLGEAKGSGSGRMNWGARNSIELISKKEADTLAANWKKARLTREMKKAITDNLDKLTFEQLQEIFLIITKNT